MINGFFLKSKLNSFVLTSDFYFSSRAFTNFSKIASLAIWSSLVYLSNASDIQRPHFFIDPSFPTLGFEAKALGKPPLKDWHE